MAGVLEEGGRLAALDDPPGIHEDDPRADLAGELHLVGHHQHRHALDGELADDGEDLADELGIERRGRLVEQHQHRLHGEGAGDRDALLRRRGARRLFRALERIPLTRSRSRFCLWPLIRRAGFSHGSA